MAKPNYDREALQELLAIIAVPLAAGFRGHIPWVGVDRDRLEAWRANWAGLVPVR